MISEKQSASSAIDELEKHAVALPQQYFDSIIGFIKAEKPSKMQVMKRKVALAKELGARRIPMDIEILLKAKNQDMNFLRKYLNTKPMRTSSGVAVVAVMTAPLRCPHGKCTYCPGGPGSFFGDVPQSYTGHEPATMRGMRTDYDSYQQVFSRLEQYIAIGQSPDKVELIIMGGTFPSYSKEYREGFVRDTLQAMNDFSRLFFSADGKGMDSFDIEAFKEFFMLPGELSDKNRASIIKQRILEAKNANVSSLEDAQLENERSRIRCIGMTIETKPDWGFLEHGNEMLRLGCTRVELGVQTIYEGVLKETHRGHTLADTKKSIQELRDLGLKLNFHMMPGLPGVSKEQDVECFRQLFSDPAYRPDMLKIYPTMVMPGTKLHMDFKAGKFTPMSTLGAAEMIAEISRYVPRYCRIMRVQRDIPTKFSIGGVDKNNLRQLSDLMMKREGYVLQDIRSREIRSDAVKEPVDFEIISYDAAGGTEYFISLKDANDRLLGFVRVRFPSRSLRQEFTARTAIIRELHVYGKAIAVGEDSEEVQHKGYGKRLMACAEEVARMHGKDKVLVISGIGVKSYYEALGYDKEGPYMAKSIMPRIRILAESTLE